jgi:NAD(P)-dependent dehydrogenase (short-subunit alcohol dehydrogenase family)
VIRPFGTAYDAGRTSESSVPLDQLRVTSGRFDGRTVIVTGAASGIGRATASRVAPEGGRVIAVDISTNRLDDLVTSLSKAQVVMVAGDITQQADIDRIVGARWLAHRRPGERRRRERRLLPRPRDIGCHLGPHPRDKPDRCVQARPSRNPCDAHGRSRRIVNVTSEAGLRGIASGTAYTVSKHEVVFAAGDEQQRPVIVVIVDEGVLVAGLQVASALPHSTRTDAGMW